MNNIENNKDILNNSNIESDSKNIQSDIVYGDPPIKGIETVPPQTRTGAKKSTVSGSAPAQQDPPKAENGETEEDRQKREAAESQRQLDEAAKKYAEELQKKEREQKKKEFEEAKKSYDDQSADGYGRYLAENGLTDNFGNGNFENWDSTNWWNFKMYGTKLTNNPGNKQDLEYEDVEDEINSNNHRPIELAKIDSTLDFTLPQYGVQDFINERALWQKGTHNLLGEPGWFYFKIFFKFNDFKGLFGGILDNKLPKTSALRYLAGIRKYYENEKIYDRMLALARFTYTLSYINSQSPWFFTGISGMNKLNELSINELAKEKSIDIVCNSDAIDMRLNTLLDMYRKACYDEINQKEIIPENLRKFDMSIVIMNIPIRYLQTAIILSGKNNALSHFTNDKNINKAIDKINNVAGFISGNTDITTFDYKTINGANGPLNRLSFQMYTLRNCEIGLESFSNYMPSSLNNTEFFKLGGGAIKINYDRCFKHTFNEWNQMMYGTDSFIYDQGDNYINENNLTSLIDRSRYSDINLINSVNDQNKRINSIKNSIYNTFFNKHATAYKSLIDFSESIIKDSMINTKNEAFLGNIYDIENTDRNDWTSTWKRTKDKLKNFFTDGW